MGDAVEFIGCTFKLFERIAAALETIASKRVESAPFASGNKASDEIAALKFAVESLRSDIAAVRRAFHDFVQLHDKVDGFDDDI
jgi:hypothetical protein